MVLEIILLPPPVWKPAVQVINSTLAPVKKPEQAQRDEMEVTTKKAKTDLRRWFRWGSRCLFVHDVSCSCWGGAQGDKQQRNNCLHASTLMFYPSLLDPCCRVLLPIKQEYCLFGLQAQSWKNSYLRDFFTLLLLHVFVLIWNTGNKELSLNPALQFGTRDLKVIFSLRFIKSHLCPVSEEQLKSWRAVCWLADQMVETGSQPLK